MGNCRSGESAAPVCTLRHYEEEFRGRHLLDGVAAHWAAVKPAAPAIVNHDRGETLSWGALAATATHLARQLLRLGFRQGDYLAASLPFLTGHVLLEYACFKIGVIHAPLDPRLRPPEVLRSVDLLRAKGYAFLGKTPATDFREVGRAVKSQCSSVEHLIQFSDPAETLDGALDFARFAACAPAVSESEYEAAAGEVGESDPAQVIFTTGSTGGAKAALLSHRNITCQNMCLGAAFGFGEDTRLLVNLPPSHVGGQAEALMTTLFWGGTAVVLEVFDAVRSLEAVERHAVNILGQIPAMYNYQWRLPDYARYRLDSLKTAIYGGQQVPASFLERLAKMAPQAGTGLGLTEAAGFCTYTRIDAGIDAMRSGIGCDMPVYPMSIRQPMRADGSAGGVLADGEVGHVCFQGPQTFLGYAGDPDATLKTIARDGVLYTGDMGSRTGDGLQFSGRAKWVIKPAGHQVFPGDVENHVCSLDRKVASCAVVGVAHPLLSEAIVAFVEKKPGVELTVSELRRHAREMASYMRPLHYVLLEPGQMPLNRAAKSDYLKLRDLAEQAARQLGWPGSG
jgi:acyl-CoA synthetase (AMP-forming)/AMP-acid ligase II